MHPDLVEEVLPADLRSRLGSLLRLDPTRAVDDFSDPRAATALARAEVLVSSWGCPPLDEKTLAMAPRLRAVIHAAGSVKGLGIPEDRWGRTLRVSSAANANALPVAQYTLAAVLLAGKRAFALAASYPDDGFRAYPTSSDTGNTERTVGVVGASRIGRLVLELLRPHGFRLLVADPHLDPAGARALGAELTDLDDLLPRADIVTLHAPLLPETRHMIDDRRLGLMRDGAVLINTARGGLVDTEALGRHCAGHPGRSGRIDAVLDVTDPEPLPADHSLFALPNVFVTPHIAGALGSELRLLGEFAVAEVGRFVLGEPLLGEIAVDDLPSIA
ncbi:hydroxyacid dehydrogenase [Streptomyces sp. FIT100]|uniref:hydroxyacid dehydrogenase n=1 Tax=Streptomyces sp. FIT100 TaxID=2837956 RepID=UPI0021C7E7EF|nr:hydroxyacid dehydrogenase [Streptomyces sp. FIT100]UUN29788.1 hydroxyacid dehydrogenase [Streptomyces sp. FIT100]